MKLLRKDRSFARRLDSIEEYVQAVLPRRRRNTVAATAGWVTAGLGAVALGLLVGRELRQRYKFNHQTPYDFYSHAGDKNHDVEFGVGV